MILQNLEAPMVTLGAAVVAAAAPSVGADVPAWVWPALFGTALAAFGAVWWRLFDGLAKKADEAKKAAEDAARKQADTAVLLARLDERTLYIQQRLDRMPDRE